MKKEKKSKRLGDGERQIQKESEELIPRAVELAEEIEALTPTQVLDMAAWLQLRISHALKSKEHTEMNERIKRFRDAYEFGVSRTNTGMDGASDYRTMLAASQCDSMTSRLVSVFSTDPIIKIEGGNELGRQNARDAELFLANHHDHNINLPMQGSAICPMLSIEGHAVLFSPYTFQIDSESREIVKAQVYINGKKTMKVDVSDQNEIMEAQKKGFVPKEPQTFVADERTKAKVVKNYPDLQTLSRMDYLIPPGTKPYPVQERPPWEAVRQYFTWDQLKTMESKGQLYKGTLKKLESYMKKTRPATGGGDDGSEVVMNTGEDKVHQDDIPFEKDSLDAVVEFWLVLGLQFLPSSGKMVECTSLFHAPSGTLCQTKVNKLIGKPRGIFHMRLLMVPFRFDGIGVMELSYMGEKAINDLACFILDEGRIYSCVPFWYNKKRFPNGVSQFEFWKGIGVLNKEKDFGVLQFNERRNTDMNVSNFIRAHAERRTGQGDLQLGRESDVTGKQPPTARGVISILREGQVRFTLMNFCLIGELVRFAQYEMSIFQQMLGDDAIQVDILGEDGKAIFPHGLTRTQILGNFMYKANHAAQALVRELDAEINFMLYDRMKDNKFIAGSLEAFYNMTRDCLLSAGKKAPLWIKSLDFYNEQSGRPSVGTMNPSEQAFVQSMMDAGVPMDRIKQLLNQIRGGGQTPDQQQSPQSEEGAAAEQALIGGQEVGNGQTT